MTTKILYLAVDKDSTMQLFEVEPVRMHDVYWDDPDEQGQMMTVTESEVCFLGIPQNRTWNDEPLKVTITIY